MILTALYFMCGITYVVLGIITLLNDPKNKSNRLFFVICMNLAFWALMTFFMNRSVDAKAASDFYLYSTFAWATFYCLLVHFIIILTGKEGFLKKRFAYLIFYFPALASIYLYAFKPETAQHFVKTNMGWIYITSTDRGFIWSNFYQ